MTQLEKIKSTAEYISSRLSMNAPIGIVLGTGLGKLADEIEEARELPYTDIPDFPQSTVEGHDGRFIHGKIGGKEVLAMKGRFHYYEGYSMNQVVLPIRVMHFLGVKQLILSNASGGMNPEYQVGDIVLLKDHINLFPDNPLLGPNQNELGPRFPDMSEPYDHQMIKVIKTCADQLNLKLHTGVYASVLGPQLETRAEYRMLQILETDAVGMSTVPEVIVAKQLNLPCAAISVLTDECDPKNLQPVNIAEIIAIAGEAEPKMITLFKEVIKKL